MPTRKTSSNGVDYRKDECEVREYTLSEEVRKKAVAIFQEWNGLSKVFNDKLGLLILGYLNGIGVTVEENEEVRLEPDMKTVRVIKKEIK